ncbi:MAG: hypothetical protein R6U44_06115 [Archaeoglobaceae archaeon]
MRERLLVSVINLALAEAAVLYAVKIYSISPFSSFYSSDLLFIPLLAVPLIFLIRKDNPFSFIHFVLLLIVCSGVFLANSETFYSLLDSAYVLGYKDLSQYVRSVFSPYEGTSVFMELLTITWMFIFSQIFWFTSEKVEFSKETGVQWGYVFSVSFLLFMVYPYFINALTTFNYPLLFMGIGGVLFLLIAFYMLSRV